MMNAWELPSALVVGGIAYKIRSDYRAVLDIIKYCSDPEYEQDERALIMLNILFEDFDAIPAEHYGEAMEAACDFIDMGIPRSDSHSLRVMDWEQDAPLIIPAVNRVLRQEVRSLDYMHWWTFLSAYLEISEGLFSTVLYLRQKKARGEKLEKHERRFVNENSKIVLLETKYSEEEKNTLAQWGVTVD